MRRNFDLSAVLAALGAVIVIVALFFAWYEPGLSAFDVFEIVDWALLGLALAALIVLGAESLGRTPPSNRLPWIAGAIGLIVIAEIIDAPPAAAGNDREVGAWLALAGVVVLGVGVLLSLARISITVGVMDRERRQRTAAVDARASDEGGDGAPAARTAGSTVAGLWQRPGDDKPKGEVEGETSPSKGADGAARPVERPTGDDTAATAADPDRTQPLTPVERPERDG